MTDFAMHADDRPPHRDTGRSTARPPQQMHLSVQILSTLLYGAFAITSVAIAFNFFWPGALALAAFLGYRGGFAPTMGRREDDRDDLVETLRWVLYEEPKRHVTGRGSGNASFDAYRQDVLVRLEQEQDSFDRFLGRLRDAKDQSEFDRFMDERADAARRDEDPRD